MSGLHNAQHVPAQKTWPDCKYCDGTGLTTRKFQRGFFAYEAGVTCPECNSKHQDEIRRKHEPEIVLTPNPYVGMKNLEFSESSNVSVKVLDLIRQARIEALEEAAKIADAVLDSDKVSFETSVAEFCELFTDAIRERAKA